MITRRSKRRCLNRWSAKVMPAIVAETSFLHQNPNDGNVCLPLLMPEAFEKARRVAPSWNIYYLKGLWRDWIRGKEEPKKPGCRFYRLLLQKVSLRKALKGMALKERRSSENKRKVSKRPSPLGTGKGPPERASGACYDERG